MRTLHASNITATLGSALLHRTSQNPLQASGLNHEGDK